MQSDTGMVTAWKETILPDRAMPAKETARALSSAGHFIID